MTSEATTNSLQYRYVKFGLIVTGETEELHLPKLFTTLMNLGTCYFEVIRRVPQLGPITSDKRKLKITGVKDKKIPSKDEKEIAWPARGYLNQQNTYAIVVDDLEHSNKEQAPAVFQRYRNALDILPETYKNRASVHFLVNMIEAYYFADAQAINAVLGTALKDYQGDVETIRHPKGDLKQLYRGFDQKEYGGEILQGLDVEKVLSNPDTCASLRTLFAWCCKCLGQTPSDRYQLLNGKLSEITRSQLDNLDNT
jgi:hypothetical protein